MMGRCRMGYTSPACRFPQAERTHAASLQYLPAGRHQDRLEVTVMISPFLRRIFRHNPIPHHVLEKGLSDLLGQA